jgi:hypothetical protein
VSWMAIGAEYSYSDLRADSSGDFGGTLTTHQNHLVFGALAFSNAAAFRAGETIDCDLFFTIGGGAMTINRQWQWTAVVGGGIRVYLPVPWLAIRFDVNSYMHPTPKPGGDAFNADLALNAGVSFIFPNREKRYEQLLKDESGGKSAD